MYPAFAFRCGFVLAAVFKIAFCFSVWVSIGWCPKDYILLSCIQFCCFPVWVSISCYPKDYILFSRVDFYTLQFVLTTFRNYAAVNTT